MRLLRALVILATLLIVTGGAFAVHAFVESATPVTPRVRETVATGQQRVVSNEPGRLVSSAPTTISTHAEQAVIPAATTGAAATGAPTATPTRPSPTATEGVLRIIIASPTPMPARSPVISSPTAVSPLPTVTTARGIMTPTVESRAVAVVASLSTGDHIVWSQGRGETRDIWVMAADGSNQSALTTGNVRNREPAVSPDGRLIAFTSNRDGNNEIYVVRSDGGNLLRLTNNPANDYAPAWSPDGRSIAFVSNRDGNDNVYVMRADGSNQTRLTDFGGFDGQPAWSPDGRLIAFTSNRDGNLNIYVMPATGGAATRLTTDRSDDRDPAWAPDGSALAFVSNRSGQFQIYTMKPDGTEQRALTNIAKGADHPAWGPATPGSSGLGRFSLAFVAYTGDAPAAAAAEIYTMRGDGSEQRRLTSNTIEDSDPAWIVTSRSVALAPTVTIPAQPPALPTRLPLSPTAAPTPAPTVAPFAPSTAEVIVDELSPQFTRGGTAKYWKEAGIGYGNHMYFTYNSAKTDNWGRWTPILPQAGKYEVLVFIPAQNATTRKATYTIIHAGAQDRQVINQLLYENEWLSLGVYAFTGKGGEYVQLTDVTGETKNSKRIGFDAVKFVYKGQ